MFNFFTRNKKAVKTKAGRRGIFMRSFQGPRESIHRIVIAIPRETLINGPTSEVAGEMASNFLDDE
ncbi:hypothetical protein, partial [Burkholderia cepacia]